MVPLELLVISVRDETFNIREIILADPNGRPLPGWEAGAHIDLQLPSGETRSYSLVNSIGDPAATTQPLSYRLGVRLEEEGKGGSRFVHNLQVGDLVNVSPPKNHFQLMPAGGETVLLAGGIGITPILSMATELRSKGAPFRLIYAGRARPHLAFMKDVEAVCGGNLVVHCDDVSGQFDVASLMSSLGDGSSLYVCGPTPMIDSAIKVASGLGWPEGRLRFEIFSAPAANADDGSFTVILAQSGKHLTVREDQTILDVLIAEDAAPLFDCKRGDCGMCQVRVISGIPDHRDYFLSDKERAANEVIQICVSRSKTPVLELDL